MDLHKKAIGYAASTCPTLVGLTIASFLLVFETAVNDIYELKQRINTGNSTINDLIINPSGLTREILLNILFVYGTAIGCIPYFFTLAHSKKQAKESRQELADDALETITGYANPTNFETPQTLSLSTVPIPIPGKSDVTDGCSRNSVRDSTGECVLLASSCGVQKWILADDKSRTGVCVRKVCSKGMVLSSDHLMCYDVNDSKLCRSRNQRAYVTATGQVVCYCKHGYIQDSFGKCHMLFTKGPCQQNYIWTKDKFGHPVCSETYCSPPLLPYKGNCVQLQRRQHCSNSKEGSKQRCRRRKAKYWRQWKKSSSSMQRREGQFVAPLLSNDRSRLSETVAVESNSLLLPCMPGSQRGFNWKCEDRDIMTGSSRSVLLPEFPSVACPENFLLTFKGECAQHGNFRNCSVEEFWNFRCP